MLTVHSSNRLERLADALAQEMRERPLAPLTPEIVVVQSLGARRWLSFALAERLGVAMNVEFPFPATLVERAFHTLAPSPLSPVFRRDVLPWRIHALLPGMWEEPGFESLRSYANGDPVKLWELAGQIAAVFDRYLAYRPNLLRAWDAGETHPDQPWQSKLWRSLPIGGTHTAALAERAGRASADANARLPARISVFGLSTLPPFHLELLGELGRRVDVHLYLLAPTQEYWGDLRSEREKRRYQRWLQQRGKAGLSDGATDPHPLLASLGKIGREFHEAVLDLTPAKEAALFEEPAGDGLLPNLQRGMLQLEVPEREGTPVYNPADRSLQVHNCHSPLRELEVLHDQLLALFDADRSLEPRDVLVSVPDITAYAPFIDAVFGAAETESTRFPYSIADRDARSQNRVTDAFLRVLDLVGSRYPASAIVSVIECPPVRERFGLNDGDLPLIRRWVAESGIRWGLDGEHRERLGFPRWEENTWRFGLNRLLLGFALPSTTRDLFEGILPEGDVEGSLAEVLGRFATFCASLFRITESFREVARSAREWAEALTAALNELCASDGDFADSWHEAAESIEAMAAAAELAGNTAALPFNVAREHVKSTLAGLDRGSEFLRGGLTFCSLKPMRAVPHRIVALLGMNDTAFPRSARPPSFDLTASQPKPGDRTTRDDDRYLFLENILSARDVLYLSYCGQSAKDDSTSPPSVLIVELLDFLAATNRSPDAQPLHDHLVTRHPLQPFHRAYFSGGDERLFSFSREASQAARIAAGLRIEAPAFLADVSRAKPDDREITIDQLANFLVHPAKHFAQEVLGMRQPFEEAALEDVEPMHLDGRDKYAIRHELADAALRGEDPNQLLTITRATGALPQGCTGEIAFGAEAQAAQALADGFAQHAPGAAVPDRFVELAVGEWRIRGFICNQRGARLARVRAATVASKDLVRAWCHHLFACAAEPDARHETLVLGTKESKLMRPVADASRQLECLLELYALGQTHPLPFFPATSEAYADAIRPPKPKSPEEAASAAEAAWNGGYMKGECEDGWHRVVWRPPAEPLSDEWREVTVRIFTPLLDHLEKLE
jgi:exodeoxyribonuclease V gamma subunit